MSVITTRSPEETEQLGERIGAAVPDGAVIALYGGLGRGKTALTRGIARAFGITQGVSSPTFALVHDYEGTRLLHHFDMYRVTDWDDLYSTGFFDYLDNGEILIIEWSENIENAIPEDAVRIRISGGEQENERKFEITGVEI